MSATRLKKTAFTGGQGLPNAGPTGLSAVLRGFAVDNARNRLLAYVAGSSDPTYANSIGGSAGASVVAMTVPSADFDATSAGGVTAAALTTALGTVSTAIGQVAQFLNAYRAQLGLAPLTGLVGSGTVGTLSAVTASATAGTGNATPTRVSVAAAFSAVRNDIATLARAANEIAAAVSVDRLTDSSGGQASFGHVVAAIPALATSTTGANSVSKTAVDAFLTAARANLNTVATYANTTVTTAFAGLQVVAAD